MKKVEYIERYGEEKWIERLERMKLRRKKEVWLAEKGEEWYREHILNPGKENAKNQRIKNPYYNKNWKEENKEHISEYNKEWRDNNPNYLNDYRNTKIGRAIDLAGSYKQHDAENGLDSSNNLTHFWIIENIFTTKCVYCGDSDWRHLGCDRIDNSKPHTPENVICACRICNIDRSDRMGVEEFKEYRKLHPRVCDIPKAPAIQLSETGAIKKRLIN